MPGILTTMSPSLDIVTGIEHIERHRGEYIEPRRKLRGAAPSELIFLEKRATGMRQWDRYDD